MDRYSLILQELIKNTGLEGASLVSADGLPISSVLKPGMEEDRIAAMSAAFCPWVKGYLKSWLGGP